VEVCRAVLRPLATITIPNKTLDFPSEKAELDLRKIACTHPKSPRAKTVFSEGSIALATLTEEKQFAAGGGLGWGFGIFA
jgi:hypothetical protein